MYTNNKEDSLNFAKYKVGNSFLELVEGDITMQDTDAIVNAANKRLAPGGGVAGAIHRAAGPKLWEECKTLGGCETGEAKITKGYNLKAKYVIHTVGPVYSGSPEDPVNLEKCYKNSLELASKNNIKTIAFPSISTGAFGYPIKEASEIAIKAIASYLKDHPEIEVVRMVLYGRSDWEVYKETADSILS
ncbi:MAG: O-acetyl-ADP-ribose deacetylase [Actinobacteria bacterium]|nr:O-acetyl-ADP-ribose deacetylase [Actinomycetota bacterium]